MRFVKLCLNQLYIFTSPKALFYGLATHPQWHFLITYNVLRTFRMKRGRRPPCKRIIPRNLAMSLRLTLLKFKII